MSGHNKWSKIKHKKAATDSARSKVFSKIVRLIQLEAKASNGDVNSPGLRLAIEKAKKANMPNDNIDRAVKKATGDGGEMHEAMFEGYGPSGIGIIVTTLSDNNNRVVQEVRHSFSKNGGNMGASGSVAWNFSKNAENEWIPNTTMELSDEDLEKLSRIVDTLEELDDVQDVYTNAE